jgi:hypothetical protein
MTVQCTDEDGNISTGDAVCLSGWDTTTTPHQPKVKRATATNLAASKSVMGIAKSISGSNVQVLVAGEVADNGLTNLTSSAGWTGDSWVIATDINNGTVANQCKLIIVQRPNGSEHVVGTCDESGNLAVQPRASRDTSAQHVFNVCSYGADPTGTNDSAQAAMDALAAMGPVDPSSAPGNRSRLYFPPGTYRFSSSVLVDRRVSIEGAVGGGVTILCDAWVTAFIFYGNTNAPANWDTLGATGLLNGNSYLSKITDLDIGGAQNPVGLTRWSSGASVSPGDRVMPGNVGGAPTDSPFFWDFHYECIAGGTTALSNPSTGPAAEFSKAQPWTTGITYALNQAVKQSDGTQAFFFVCTTAAGTPTTGSAPLFSTVTTPGNSIPDAVGNHWTAFSIATWTPSTIEIVGNVVKIVGIDDIFFICTSVAGGNTTGTDPSVFAGQTAGVAFTTDNGVEWTPFTTGEPDWRKCNVIDDSKVWAANTPTSYGSVVRPTARTDIQYMCISPDVNSVAVKTGGSEPVGTGTLQSPITPGFNNCIVGDSFTDGAGITWRAWDTGAESAIAAWSNITYQRGDKVTSNGATWVCKIGGAAVSAPTYPSASPIWVEVTDGVCTWRRYALGTQFRGDGSGVIWACRATNGIRALARIECARLNIGPFPNAGIHLAGDFSSTLDDGAGSVPPTSTNCWTLDQVTIGDCGVGVLTLGGDCNAGTGYEVNVTGQTDANSQYPGEVGLEDRSFLGNRWITPFVQNTGGPGYYSDSAASTGSAFGAYFEFTGAIDVPNAEWFCFVWGTLTGATKTVFGQPSVYGFTERSICTRFAAGAWGGGYNIREDDGSLGVFGLGQLTMQPAQSFTDDGWYAWQWQHLGTGWWSREYYDDYYNGPAYGISSGSATEGYGQFWMPRGFFCGRGSERYYTFPGRLVSQGGSNPQNRIKAGYRDIGDRRVLVSEAAVGAYLEQVVTTAGYEGPPWSAGMLAQAAVASGPQKRAGDTVTPSNPAATDVFVCLSGGYTDSNPANEPTWTAYAPPNPTIPFSEATGVTWQWLGTRAVWTDTTLLGRVERVAMTLTNAAASPYSVQQGDFHIACDTTGSVTVALPTSPVDGESYEVKDATGGAAVNPITVDGGVINIDNATTQAIAAAWGAMRLRYSTATGSWLQV